MAKLLLLQGPGQNPALKSIIHGMLLGVLRKKVLQKYGLSLIIAINFIGQVSAKHSQGLVLLVPAGAHSPGKAGQAPSCLAPAGDRATAEGYHRQALPELKSV